MNRQRSEFHAPAEGTTHGVGRHCRFAVGVLATLSRAALLEPGQCQIETWFDRATGSAHSLLHVGPACCVGEVELGRNVDRERRAGTPSTTAFGPQVKWAVALNDDWSASIVLSTTGRNRSPRYLGSTVVIPVTWRVGEPVLVHLNVGRDIRRADRDTYRGGGLALEWAPLETCSFVAERFRDNGGNYWRTGARWALTSTSSVDLGRAGGVGGSALLWWTLGVNWAFAR